jgi:hypothetical protein
VFRDPGRFVEYVPSGQRHSARTVRSTVAATGVRFAS